MLAKSTLSIVLTAYDGDVSDLRKIIQCLRNQTCDDFNVVPVLKLSTGSIPDLSNWFDGITDKWYITPPGDTTGGNAQRRHGLDLATGEYICWVSADNLLYNDFVEQHLSNFCSDVDTSIVNVDYWRETCWGVLPRKLAMSHVDLLNFALRTDTARKLDAFNEVDQHTWESDWRVLGRALRSRRYHWDKDAKTCAAHF